MFSLVYVLCALSFSDSLNRVPSRLLLRAGNTVAIEPSLDLSMEDVHQYLEFLSHNQVGQKRTFGPIGTSLLHQRRHSILLLLDADLKSDITKFQTALEIQPRNRQFMKFSRSIYEHSYTLSSVYINETVISQFAEAVHGTQDKDTLTIDGVTFSASVPSEAKFLDDIRKLATLPEFAKELRSIRYAASIELTLISTMHLPEEKQAAARAILLKLAEETIAALDNQNKFIIATIFTDFSDHKTYHPYSYEHPRPATIQDSAQIVTARFNRPIRTDAFLEKLHPTLKRAMKKPNDEDDTTESHVQYVIGPPRTITGRPGFHFFFWTILFLFIALIVVSVLMWNMKTFEDPLIYNTEYVPEPDSAALGEDD